MKLLHTSDWHLGHYLHGHDRDHEHAAFLAWLRQTCREQAIDALIVAGDIFDAANPPARAQAMYYEFLSELHRDCPNLDMVIVGGNHDSALRLDAPLPLLQGLNIHMVGGLPRTQGRQVNWDRLCVPLTNAAGEIGAWCAALPYLRPAELPQSLVREDALIEGTRQIYAEVLDHLRTKASPAQALIATGHCYVAGTLLSELSERKVQRGNQQALPADIFPEDLTYVALGHLHRPQQAAKPHIRYSGSPIPLSMAEQAYQHQVVIVHLEKGELRDWEPLLVPRTVDLLRLPGPDQAKPWDAVKPLLEALDDKTEASVLKNLPFLEVQILLDKPEPGLRHKVAEVLAQKAVRLVKLTTQYKGNPGGLADAIPDVALQDLQPEEVFERKYQSTYDTEETPEVYRLAFFELLEQLQNGGTS